MNRREERRYLLDVARDRVLEALSDGAPCSRAYISRRSGEVGSRLTRALAELVADGRVHRSGANRGTLYQRTLSA